MLSGAVIKGGTVGTAGPLAAGSVIAAAASVREGRIKFCQFLLKNLSYIGLSIIGENIFFKRPSIGTCFSTQ